MDGSSFGRHFGEAIITLMIVCGALGAVVGVALWVVVPWIAHHVTLTVS